MIYIGIDPGAGGGIAWSSDSNVYRGAVATPATDRDVVDLLEQFKGDKAIAVLERVWSSPGWGHVGAFKFGLSYGALRMALTAARVPFEEVLPRKWQQLLGVSYPKGKPRDKNVTKQRAQQLFPELTITHAIADALLIAEYCRRVHRLSDGKEEGNPAQGNTEAGRKRSRQRDRQDSTIEIKPILYISAAEARTPVRHASRHGADPRRSSR